MLGSHWCQIAVALRRDAHTELAAIVFPRPRDRSHDAFSSLKALTQNGPVLQILLVAFPFFALVLAGYVARAKVTELIASVPPCLIGIEACTGAHHWAGEFAKLGHTVRTMAPKFLVPYRMSGKRGKNDAADAAAICEAVTRPNMLELRGAARQGRRAQHGPGVWASKTHRRCTRSKVNGRTKHFAVGPVRVHSQAAPARPQT